nr:MAG TPA: Putative HNHc nuclease [Caudoviricetes sp.]
MAIKTMSWENQKLIYWFIDCFAYYLADKDISNLSSKEKTGISDYYRFQSKEKLKKLYIKASGKSLKGYEPFKNLNEKLEKKIIEVLEKKYTNKNKAKIILDILMKFVIEEMKFLLIKLEGTFSLALKMVTNQEAIEFTNFLFDYFMDNEIPMWNQMHELYRKQNNRKWVYWMLKKKICVITGKPNAQLAHISKSAGALGGYEFDKGIGNSYLPLSAEWHIGVDHGVGGGRGKLMAKLREIYVEPFEIKKAEEVKELKKVYPGHFKAFKGK